MMTFLFGEVGQLVGKGHRLPEVLKTVFALKVTVGVESSHLPVPAGALSRAFGPSVERHRGRERISDPQVSIVDLRPVGV